MLTNILKGMAMGIADLIPGVSGATIAVILRIYQRFILALSNINVNWIICLYKGNKNKAFIHILRMDPLFLVSVGLGIGISLLFFSRVVFYFRSTHPELTLAFFFGLIATSAFFLLKKITFQILPFSIGALGGMSFLLISSITLAKTPLLLFLSGFLAICAMLLPGISGSYVLELIGMYEYILSLVSQLTQNPLLSVPLIFFALGMLPGILLMAHLGSFLLKHYKQRTYLVLIGLIFGSLLPLGARIGEFSPSILASVSAGFLVAMLLHWAVLS
ncbi:MAG: DUF368 domain-containing protein [Candidatus Woesearchaeota archaeon]